MLKGLLRGPDVDAMGAFVAAVTAREKPHRQATIGFKAVRVLGRAPVRAPGRA
jgi:hypothetical protein